MEQFLDEVIARQEAERLANLEANQRERIAYARQLRADMAQEIATPRVHRFATEVEHGQLEGEEATQRIRANTAHNENQRNWYVTQEQTAKDQLTAIEAQVCRLMNIGYEIGLAIKQGNPDVASAVSSCFHMQVAVATKAAATPLRHSKKENDPQAKRTPRPRKKVA